MTGGGTSTTSYTMPSQFDADKAVTAKLMRNLLVPNIISGLRGQGTAAKSQSVSSLLQANKYNAGRFGQEVGNPLLKNAERRANESLTMPDKDMLSQAMKMYGLSDAKGTPSTINDTAQHTNVWDYVGGLLKMIGAAGGGGGGK